MKINKCTVCGDKKSNLIYKYDDYSLVRCSNCSHYYTLIINELNEKELYNSGDYKSYDSRKSIFEKIINYQNKLILNKIEHLNKGKNILDFGSGKGKFLNICQERNWNTYGVETSDERASYSERSYGLKINRNFYNNGKLGNDQFDVICFFHVLEHLDNPKQLLENIIEYNLKDDGLLVIEVPNFESLQSKISQNKWLHLDIPRHINHFTYTKISEVINNLGLSIIKRENFSYIHGLQGMLNALFSLFGYKKNIITQLKFKRTYTLLANILITLPFAFILEYFASQFNSGAVLRLYIKKSNHK